METGKLRRSLRIKNQKKTDYVQMMGEYTFLDLEEEKRLIYKSLQKKKKIKKSIETQTLHWTQTDMAYGNIKH